MPTAEPRILCSDGKPMPTEARPTIQHNFRFSPETIAALDRVASRYQIDRVSTIRVLIHQADERGRREEQPGPSQNA